jgi:hypothetical protein
MGFVVKSAFWLGIVYWSMPFDQVPSWEASAGAVCPAAYATLSRQLEAVPESYRALVAAGCVALATAKVESGGPRSADPIAKPAKPMRTAAIVSPEIKDRAAPRPAREPEPPPRRPNKG